jgi:hypothetical protein
MSNIQFEEDQFSATGPGYQVKSGTPKMVQWLVDKGIVKSEQIALYVLLGIAVVAFGLALIVSMNVFGGDLRQDTSYPIIDGVELFK